MQCQVLLSNFCVDHATHVLPQHGIVRQHGAFGHGLGAAGVHNLCQILAGQTALWQRVSASRQLVEVQHAGYWLAGIFRGQPHKLFDLCVQCSSLFGQVGQA